MVKVRFFCLCILWDLCIIIVIIQYGCVGMYWSHKLQSFHSIDKMWLHCVIFKMDFQKSILKITKYSKKYFENSK